MKIFYDLRLGYLVSLPGSDTALTQLQGKAGDEEELVIQFGRSSDPTASTSIISSPVWTPENLTGGSVITAAIKLADEYSDGTALATNSTWVNDPAEFTYTGALDLNTTEINAALSRINADDTDDIASVECGFEVTIQVGGSGGWRSSILPVTFTVYHDIISGVEATPTDAADPTEYLLKASAIEYYPTVTSKIGGTAADLDSIATTTLTVGKAIQFIDEDGASDLNRTYRLVAGVTAESSPDVIRPDDFDASTNAKIWELLQIQDGLTELLEDTDPNLGGVLETNAHQVRFSKGADVASAAALTLGTDGNSFDVTGTTAITSIATLGVGTVVKLRFTGILTLTYHATDLILPSGASITTAAGDQAEFLEYALGDWRCTAYTKANGKAVVETTPPVAQTTFYVPVTDMQPAVTSPPSAGTTETTTYNWTYSTYDFDTSANEYLHFIKAMPSNWDLGTITAKFHWSAASGSGTVRWGIQAASIANDAVLDLSPGTSQTTTDTLIAALDMHITAATPATTINGTLALGNPVIFKIFRSVAGDTLAVDAKLIGVEITYGAL
jgi:hypothetical protein